jgi:hypothetical protein
MGQGVGSGPVCPQGEGPRLSVYPKRLPVVIRPRVPLGVWGVFVRAGSRPRFYTGGQKKNQKVSATDTRKAAALPLTTLLAITLTVGEALVVAKAAIVAAITNAMLSTKKMTSIIPPTTWLRTAASVSLDHIRRSQRPDRKDETVRPLRSTPIDLALPLLSETVGQPRSPSCFSPSQHRMLVSRTQLYAGGQKKHQAVSAHRDQGSVKLPLIVLLAMPLTVCEAPVVATAASAATITKARTSSRQIMSTMTIP